MLVKCRFFKARQNCQIVKVIEDFSFLKLSASIISQIIIRYIYICINISHLS